jgi:hypothetical protein
MWKTTSKENKMKTSEILMNAQALIANPANWTQGNFAKDINNVDTNILSDDAVCFCSIGAVRKVVGLDSFYFGLDSDEKRSYYFSAYKFLEDSVDGLFVAAFNDSSTHAQVMEMFETAIALAQQEGN